ncbi:hypothetical protein SNE40_008884 [Patella caerulea]|uniref:Translin-associated factor X-interacting protein 1 N-terminal domain-containing protein n=1 Tax=Patella caerulea TaxID=87958 RepID=A0AAN8JUK2_PATCE
MDSSSSFSSSTFCKLPPIVTNETDRIFLQEVNKFVEKELVKLGHKADEEQNYLIYKSVFNRVIEHVTAYKPVLTAIKKEYETTIDAITNGQKEAVFLQGRLKAMASEPSTIRNYRKRADQLEERINYIKKNNKELESQLLAARTAREEREKKENEIKEIPRRQLKKDRRSIPGLTLEEQTDLPLLQKKLEKLDRQLRELNISFKTRYLPKSNNLELKDHLDKKVSFRDHLLSQSQAFKARSHRMKIALEAAEAYNGVKPPNQTVGDAVVLAFQHYFGQQAAKTEVTNLEGETGTSEATTTSQFEEDDPNKEKEAEMMLEYIEKFNELFEDGKFEEAAIHAANSPKGILRTQATLSKFRDVKLWFNGGRTPLLAFCDALMSSVKATGSKPGVGLSVDCIRCALSENRLDLLAHWVAQDSLSLSRDIGVLLDEHCSCQIPCKCGCQALAQTIFTGLREHQNVVICLVKQGRVLTGLQYAKIKGTLEAEFLVFLIKTCPSVQLFLGLSEEHDATGTSIVPIGVILKTLLQMDNLNLGVKFLQQFQKSKKKGDGDKDKNVLREAIFNDHITTSNEWNRVVKGLQEEGHNEISIQMSAIILVVDALKNALNILNYSLLEA